MTKRQKMLLATFFLGLISLGVDCLFLRPGGAAPTASEDAAKRYAVPASPRDDPAPLPTEMQGRRVAECLDRLCPQGQVNMEDVRDPFALPVSWSGRPVEDPAQKPDSAGAFARSHTLEAVVLDARQSRALVGDRFLTPGQQIDGFTLVSVGHQSAVFERQGERVILELVK